VEKVLRLLDPQLRNSSIRVYQDWGAEIPQVLVVENQIQQVFFNIVLNAMQVMPTGGELYIQTHPGRDGQVEIIFEDTGPGVSEENSNQIFEPFISTKENGLGLGLTVSYGIVSAHGGNLELLPRAGRGARFRVSLPTGTTSRSER
jgi:signal transduction histidine kinase